MKTKSFISELRSDESLKSDMIKMLSHAYSACEVQVYTELNGKRYFSSADIQRVGNMAARKVLNGWFNNVVFSKNKEFFEKYLSCIKEQCYVAYRDSIAQVYCSNYKKLRAESANKRILRANIEKVSWRAADEFVSSLLEKKSIFGWLWKLVSRLLALLLE